MENWATKIVSIKTENAFNTLALEAYKYQFNSISVYNEYCRNIKKTPENVKSFSDIPFLPIEFFKTHKIMPENQLPECIFSSSGTTGVQTSQHYIIDIEIYKQSFIKGFNSFYGEIDDYCILALLPSYLERDGSSLVYMANDFIKLSNHVDSGFYLNNYNELAIKLEALNETNQKVILLGVTYALLDMAEQYPMNLRNTIIMETGGMKGRRKELTRDELHTKLCSSFGVKSIHSEYGMTELLSQAYSKGEGIFETPPWMKVLIRDTYDPFTYFKTSQSGGINVVDLANINSCCFIETKDIGKIYSNNKFTVLGRFDNSDIRGCNLLMS